MAFEALGSTVHNIDTQQRKGYAAYQNSERKLRMTSLYKRCQNCGKDLGHDATYRKQFCSDACRVAYHRTKSAQTLYSEAITTISKFSKVSKAEKKQAIENLKQLQTIIKHELYLLGDADELARIEMIEDLQRK